MMFAARKQQQQGVALIAVLMVVALVVVIAVSMSGRLQLQLQRQLNLQDRQQALWLALGAEEFSRNLLKRTAVGKDTVNLSQEWAAQGATFPVEQGSISGKITDLQSCFNLNSLQKAQEPQQPGNNQDPNQDQEQGENQRQDQQAGNESKDKTPQPNAKGGAPQTPAQLSFQRLLEQSASELSMPAEYLVARLTDWLDADTALQSAGGAEENDYAALEFPYYTANSLMVSKSELRVLLDMTAADYALVAPLVCVIPQQSVLQLNVNTITEQQATLLSGLISGLSEDDAQALIAARPEKGYENLDQFFASSQLSGLQLSDESKTLFSVTSSYFQAELTVQLADSSFKLTSVLKVNDNQVQVVARRFGGQG
ncbi:type II secretory pathway protein [Rheinheimera sp. SA_1]|jgi:general secretion pathway protein K|uniref:type II secretion system minor pseudopilin GspK n=1 Tax=Rheinheimera sp. SA_1 TaxID=1827365 RepID=UPI0007FE2039|nr:type II secretion system minor pseudopilin GspK [Rheinheimera sp. SA_1]OBP13268.1 type II secretory pathway protein [Rheinheimera sp. SA_1]